MTLIFYSIGVLIAVAVATKIYLKLVTRMCQSKTCLIGKTAIITGANTGIGYETAVNFAMRGAKVILACRDATRATKAKETIIQKTGNPNISVENLELASFESVRRFARHISKTETRLDILVLNAGAGGLRDSKSTDGNLLLMQINYFSNFLLVQLLIDLLRTTGNARIINVSSITARWPSDSFNADNLNHYPGNPYHLYVNTKLCNILFTRELAGRLKNDVKSSVAVFSVHPGVVNTEIFRHLPKISKIIFDAVVTVFMKTPEEGAQTTIYTAVEPNLEVFTGEHFEDCHVVKPYKSVIQHSGNLKKLWENTGNIINMTPGEIRV